jgi:uncharacterized tellurite resistance protein B-like protein
MIIHDTFAEFVLFLYIHMAHADGEYHASEEKAIRGKLHKLFPNNANPEEKLKNELEKYKKTKAEDLKVLIHDTFFHFDHIKFSQKYKVYTDMFDIVHADGKLHEAEERALKELKDIIDAGSEVGHKN